jgi:ribosomal protein L21E
MVVKNKKLKIKKGLRLSEYFKEFKVGDEVALSKNFTFTGNFPKTFKGNTGTIMKKIKNAYEVKFLKGHTYKSLVIRPTHLKKIN